MAIRIKFAMEREGKRNLLRRSLPLTICLVALLLAAWLFRAEISAFRESLGDREQLTARAEALGPWAPLALALLLMLQVIIPMIPGQAVVLTIGYLYGPVWGGLLTATAIFLSGQIAFAVARRAGRPLVYRLASPKALEYWERLAARQGTAFYICAYTLPFMPSDLLVYVAGLGRLSARRFTVANIFGRLPLGVVVATLGAYHLKPPLAFWAIPGLIVLLALIGASISLRLPQLIVSRGPVWTSQVRSKLIRGGCPEAVE